MFSFQVKQLCIEQVQMHGDADPALKLLWDPANITSSRRHVASMRQRFSYVLHRTVLSTTGVLHCLTWHVSPGLLTLLVPGVGVCRGDIYRGVRGLWAMYSTSQQPVQLPTLGPHGIALYVAMHLRPCTFVPAARWCLEAAAARYAEALRLHPDNPQALNNWGLILQVGGEGKQTVCCNVVTMQARCSCATMHAQPSLLLVAL